MYKEKGVTGRKRDRRVELAKLLKDITESKPVDYVIVYKLDRLARNTIDDSMMTEEIEDAGARLISVMEQFDDSSPQGWMMHRMFAMFAEYESRNSGQRVAMGMQRKAELGGTPSKPPIGYLAVREPNPKGGRGISRIVVDDVRAPLVRWAFESYARYDWSVSRLAEELDERGLRSKPHRRNGIPKALPKNRVHRMLRNRYYIGKVIFKDQEYQGEHVPLIPEPLFNKVQALLESRRLSETRYRTHDHYLKGSIFCARCKHRLYQAKVTNRHGTTYEYFLCRGRQLKECDMPYLRADMIEQKIEHMYRTTFLSPEAADGLRHFLDHDLEALDDENDKVVAAQKLRLKNLLEEEKKNAAAYRADAISIDVLKDERERIDKERQDADRVIARAGIRYQDLRHTIEQAIDLSQNWHSSYTTAPPRIRKQLNLNFFEKIIVHADTDCAYELSEAFQALADAAEAMTHPDDTQTEQTSYHRSATHDRDRNNKEDPSRRNMPADWGPTFFDEGSSKNLLVREGGLEPPRPEGHRHLKPARLPIPPLARVERRSVAASEQSCVGFGDEPHRTPQHLPRFAPRNRAVCHAQPLGRGLGGATRTSWLRCVGHNLLGVRQVVGAQRRRSNTVRARRACGRHL